MDRKITIYLAGDSTVQSYSAADAPQEGWGQELVHFFCDNEFTVTHSPGSAFDSSIRYETDELFIDNRAFAGRGTKNYIAEGRAEDVTRALQKGDLMLMQFGHNDANREKPERYVTPSEFKDNLTRFFITPALEAGAIPVPVTPLSMCVFDEDGVCRPAFNEYRRACLELGEKLGLHVIDLGKVSAALNTRIGSKACRSLYLNVPPGIYPKKAEGHEDYAHLQYTGARVYAGLVAEELKKILCTCEK